MNNNPKKILIVDDNEINRTFFSMALKKANYECEMTDSGQEALRLCEINTYDLILLDIRMPDLDGYKVANELTNRNISTGILATSADTLSHKKSNHFSDFIMKPVKPKDLINKVNELINGKSTELFDKQKALDFCYQDETILQRILGMFIKEFPTQITQLKHFSVENNTQETRELLHKMRGSCRTCGAMELDSILSKAENILRTEGQLKNQIDLLESSYSEFLKICNI